MIPNVIAENTQETVIPLQVKQAILSCDYFLAENIRTARRYISSLKTGLHIEKLKFELLDKNTSFETCKNLIQPVIAGRQAGVISESGCPGIADPGARLVHIAHQFGLAVVPLVGPTSILLALMGSGFNGQSFAFHGYLPIEKRSRQQRIRQLETESWEKDQTQLFIETPYRNQQLLSSLLQTLHKDTQLCIARDVTGAQEAIITKPVGKWRPQELNLKKTPAIFLIYAA